ncbi:MAG: general secretion pathway protein GspB, partial [Desulfobacterota bacterium]|nr:general secretion pathway protein GspB [Thermodesulfobacteriota bacterium]
NDPIVLGLTREIQKYRDNFSPKEEAKTVNRDPFLNVKIQSPNLDKQNLRLKENQTDRLKLTGINYSANSRTAIINRHIVAEGDLIAGWKVVEIRKDRVILELKNKRSSLYLNQNPSLSPAEENPLFTKEE